MKTLGLLILLITTPLFANAQDILGCTDSQANNFDEDANVNDGSCTYNPTIYKPDFRFHLNDEVEETSGLIFWNGGFWTHNDSGGEPIIYKLDTLGGDVLQRIKLNGASNVDWEDIAQDEVFIYVGDFGNNSGNRDDLAIYIVDKSDIPDSGDLEINSQKITFTYDDHHGKAEKRKDNNFDCEAMIATTDFLYLFSKNRGDNKSKLYRLPKTAGDYTAELLETFNSAGLVTGADLNKDKDNLVLVGYTNNTWIPFMWVMFDFQGEDFFSGNKRRIDMLNIPATQTEGICFTNSENGIISSEKNPLFATTAYSFSISKWIAGNPSAISENNKVGFNFKLYPNPLTRKKITLRFTNMPADDYQISVYDSMGKMMKMKKYSIGKLKDDYIVKMNMKNLKPGIYFVRVSGGDGIFEKKFIKE